MAKGLSGIRGAVKEIEARKAGSGDSSGRIQWFRLADTKSANVRFLEQGDDVAWCWAHQLPPVGQQKFGDWEPCINTNNDGAACPGCERKLARKVRGYINLVWLDGPRIVREEFTREDGTKGMKAARDAEGNIVMDTPGPMLAVWAAGVTVFEELDGLDAAYKGLSSREFRVTRRGTQLNTKYQILPMDPEPMSDEVKALAAQKLDLAPFVTPKAYDEWGGAGAQAAQDESAGDGNFNPFLEARG